MNTWWRCKTCGETGDTITGSIMHECEGAPVRICEKCWLTKPCECEDN